MSLPRVFGTEDELLVASPPGAPALSSEDADRMKVELLATMGRYFFSDQLEHSMHVKVWGGDERMQTQSSYQEMPVLVTPAALLRGISLSGFMTPLGGRLYLDHGYVENSSPECIDPWEQVASVIAFEELLEKQFSERFGSDPRKPTLYKNVSDGAGHSQGAHRNFCISRSLFNRIMSCRRDAGPFAHRLPNYFSREAKIIAAWGVAEIPYIGAGKVGDEMKEAPRGSGQFQISGRADFLECCATDETMARRGVINFRDEALADTDRYGRYHCITGDANRAEWSQVFRIGLPALVFGMLEADACNLDWYICDPVSAFHAVSRDLTLSRPIPVALLRDSGQVFEKNIREILKAFFAEIERYLATHSVPAWCGVVFQKAEEVLSAFTNSPASLETILDWKIKEKLCRGRKRPHLIHTQYHALSDASLYRALVNDGKVDRVISRALVERLKVSPPESTRAYFRGMCLKHFPEVIPPVLARWSQLFFLRQGPEGQEHGTILLPEPLALTRAQCGSIFEEVSPSYSLAIRLGETFEK